MRYFRVWSLRVGMIDPPELLDETEQRRLRMLARSEELAWKSIHKRVEDFYAERREQ